MPSSPSSWLPTDAPRPRTHEPALPRAVQRPSTSNPIVRRLARDAPAARGECERGGVMRARGSALAASSLTPSRPKPSAEAPCHTLATELAYHPPRRKLCRFAHFSHLKTHPILSNLLRRVSAGARADDGGEVANTRAITRRRVRRALTALTATLAACPSFGCSEVIDATDNAPPVHRQAQAQTTTGGVQYGPFSPPPRLNAPTNLPASFVDKRSSGFRVGRESRIEVETSAAEEHRDAEVREASESERALLDHLDGRVDRLARGVRHGVGEVAEDVG